MEHTLRYIFQNFFYGKVENFMLEKEIRNMWNVLLNEGLTTLK